MCLLEHFIRNSEWAGFKSRKLWKQEACGKLGGEEGCGDEQATQKKPLDGNGAGTQADQTSPVPLWSLGIIVSHRAMGHQEVTPAL